MSEPHPITIIEIETVAQLEEHFGPYFDGVQQKHHLGSRPRGVERQLGDRWPEDEYDPEGFPMSDAPKKWTKKDIKTLCAQLDTAWLKFRPLDGMFSPDPYEKRSRSFVSQLTERTRLELVLAGLRSMRDMHAERYRKNCESIGNAIARPKVWGDSSAEIIERFTKSAREEDASHAAYEALVLRVVNEGLPDEVNAYDPTKNG